jgi:hypothetical protein
VSAADSSLPPIPAWNGDALPLTDNGAEFTAAPRHGRCAMELELASLGIRYIHSTSYHPQTCGKVERLHQTAKRYVAKRPKPTTVLELQTQLDTFVAYYNEVRPHRSLGRRTPAAAFAARPKASPSGPRLEIPPHVRVRRDKIDITGVITLRHNSRLHHTSAWAAGWSERGCSCSWTGYGSGS